MINGRDAKHAKVRYPLNPPLEIKGINGVATATEGCILQVGKLEVQGPIIEGAARSVVNPRSLMHTGGKAQPSGGSKNFIGFSFLVFHNSHLVVKYAKSVENVWGSKKNLSKPAPIVAPNVSD